MPDDLPFVPDATLDLVGAGWWLELRCACGRSTSIPHRLLVQAHGRRARVPNLLARLRCAQCGSPPATAAKRRDEELATIRERAGRLEGESETLREQLKAERNRSVAQIREVEAARDVAKADLARWTAGGALERAWRALVYRRGQ